MIIPADLQHHLRVVDRAELDAAMLSRVAVVEKSGAHVTLIEVIADGTILVFAHTSTEPDPTKVRTVYAQHAQQICERCS